MPFHRNHARRATAALILAASTQAQAGPTSTPGEITRKHSDIVYGIAQQETLSSIAARFTGSARNWPALAKANGIANDRTIPIGSSIVIPSRLLPDKAAFATVVALRGTVNMVDKAGEVVDSRIGVQIGEGALVVTGEDGFVTFQLKDGTRFALPPASNLQLTALKVQDFTERPRTALTLNKGRVTSEVTPFTLPHSQYQIQTPLAIAGVRGTRFRIHLDGAASYSEVLHGAVNVAAAGAPARRLAADYGSVVGSDGRQSAPIALLTAPQLQGTQPVQDRLPVRVQLAQPEAASFRVGIALDQDGMQRIAEVAAMPVEGQAQARFAELEDGDYIVRAAAIDGRGLEGREAILPLRLKARPFAPMLQAPGAKLRGSGADADADKTTPAGFVWAQVLQAASYHLQIARDRDFKQLVADRPALTEPHFQHPGLAQGDYFWRVASVAQKNGQADQGPWSDASALAVLPPQRAPEASQDEDGMRFSWRGEAGQRFVFESAADPGFQHPQQHIETGEPRVAFAVPDAGVYYARVQTIETDGYRGPFSAPQKYTVERRWRTGSGGSLISGQGPVRGN